VDVIRPLERIAWWALGRSLGFLLFLLGRSRRGALLRQAEQWHERRSDAASYDAEHPAHQEGRGHKVPLLHEPCFARPGGRDTEASPPSPRRYYLAKLRLRGLEMAIATTSAPFAPHLELRIRCPIVDYGTLRFIADVKRARPRVNPRAASASQRR